jgi:2-haloacid dehalogenase
MASTNFRPKYISYDVYGTLINFNIYPTTVRLLDGRISEERWPEFKKVFHAYRFDEVNGDYKPYEQILQDAFDRACKRFGIGPTPVPAQGSLRLYAMLLPTRTCRLR